MGNADWSLDHLKQDVAAGAPWVETLQFSDSARHAESAPLVEGVLNYMSSALRQVSESLEAQKRLRRELTQLREDARKVQAAQEERIRSLEAEACALRRALEEERSGARFALLRTGGVEMPQAPPQEHLDRPLVLQSQQGDFLGVTDKLGQVLTLTGFMRLVETGAPARERMVASCWEAGSSGWSLSLCLSGGPLLRKCYVFETSPMCTPSGNKVTLLSRVSVDGTAVPAGFVVQMFRQLRESFQEE